MRNPTVCRSIFDSPATELHRCPVMNLKEFFADNLGRDFTGIVAEALNLYIMRRSVILI